MVLLEIRILFLRRKRGQLAVGWLHLSLLRLALMLPLQLVCTVLCWVQSELVVHRV